MMPENELADINGLTSFLHNRIGLSQPVNSITMFLFASLVFLRNFPAYCKTSPQFKR